MKKEIDRLRGLIKQCEENIENRQKADPFTEFDESYISTMRRVKEALEERRSKLTSQIGRKG